MPDEAPVMSQTRDMVRRGVEGLAVDAVVKVVSLAIVTERLGVVPV